MPKHEAWFFKQKHLDWLKEHGAAVSKKTTNKTPVAKKSSSKLVSLKNMKLSKYGRGWLLKPKKNSKSYGEKYFHNGWWMPKHEAWFFKQEHLDWLKKNI